MLTVNQQFVNSILLNQIRIENLSTDSIKTILARLKADDQRLLGLFTIKSIDSSFIKTVAQITRDSFAITTEKIISELEGFSRSQTVFMDDLFGLYFGDSLVVKQKFSEVADVIVRGVKLTETLKTLERSFVQKYIAIARVSYADGLLLDDSLELINNLISKKNRHTETLLRTALTTVSDNLNSKSIKNNTGIIKGIKLVVTFDTRTSQICKQHSNDDKLYSPKNYLHPPFHFNCRTVAVPITKSWSELGGKKRKVPMKHRSTMTGLVPENLTYNQWVSRQKNGIQDEILGKKKANLYRLGKLKLTNYKPRG